MTEYKLKGLAFEFISNQNFTTLYEWTGVYVMDIVNNMLEGIEIPKFALVRQHFETDSIDDVACVIDDNFKDNKFKDKIKNGQKIGITVGSRGIANLKEIVRSVCTNIKKLGAEPVIIPSMGSHGGATAEGQREVLEELGVTEEFTGAVIMSGMEVVKLGETDDGIPVYYDKIAIELDGVILLNRIKAHTDIDGDIESGLHKIIAIGLGNHIGAEIVHNKGLDKASGRIKSVGRFVLENANIMFGIALLENAYDETSHIVFLENSEIMQKEPELLIQSKKQLPRFLFNDIDVLIVDYIGKNISGDGMDPNVIGRCMIGTKNKEIKIRYIATLNLTHETKTSALGVGLSDVTTRKIYDKLEFEPMYVNAITAIAIRGPRIPMVMDDDKKALQLAVKACCADDNKSLRIARIRDTLSLREIMVSESLLEDVRSNPNIEVISELKELEFDENNNLAGFI